MRTLPIPSMSRPRTLPESEAPASPERARGGLAALLAGALVLALAAPALAGEVYRWDTPEGGVAFTDDAERIPPRHRDAAQRVETEGLAGYARFTPERDERAGGYPERLAQRLERLRALNAAADRAEAGVRARRRSGGAVLEMRHGMKLRVPAPSAGGPDEPLVVEEVRVREPGRSATKTDTVVRRGDRVYVVVSPLGVSRSRPGEVPSEAELLRPGGAERAE